MALKASDSLHINTRCTPHSEQATVSLGKEASNHVYIGIGNRAFIALFNPLIYYNSLLGRKQQESQPALPATYTIIWLSELFT